MTKVDLTSAVEACSVVLKKESLLSLGIYFDEKLISNLSKCLFSPPPSTPLINFCLLRHTCKVVTIEEFGNHIPQFPFHSSSLDCIQCSQIFLRYQFKTINLTR